QKKIALFALDDSKIMIKKTVILFYKLKNKRRGMGGKRMNGNSRAGYKKRPGAVEIYTYELLACIMPSCFYPVCSYVVTAIVGTCGTPKSKYLLSLLLPH
ncbi:hypothetical protein, partial [Hallella colorans]|uniref:hypothetical protein n=1 Tax=Hallella colorans TaxID=1703337 RepID=UPI00288A0227